uniref:Uncharacterized protein n=1 Tax=Ananas comosus var. bracteatus TaxID=296719 RepID=A0A6V7NSX2_ANACO|nr:unnamed protein product [Ananas comosus var. bracteatus]
MAESFHAILGTTASNTENVVERHAVLSVEGETSGQSDQQEPSLAQALGKMTLNRKLASSPNRTPRSRFIANHGVRSRLLAVSTSALPHRSLSTFRLPSVAACCPTSRYRSKLFAVRMASTDSSAPAPAPAPPPPPAHTITLPGGAALQIVAAAGVSEPDFRNAISCALFKQWLNNIQSEKGLLAHGKMCLRQVQIQGVDMFGRRVGFLKFKADVIEKETGTKIPGIVFARGPAVAVLILLESGGDTYAVLTEQVRVPVGKSFLNYQLA